MKASAKSTSRVEALQLAAKEMAERTKELTIELHLAAFSMAIAKAWGSRVPELVGCWWQCSRIIAASKLIWNPRFVVDKSYVATDLMKPLNYEGICVSLPPQMSILGSAGGSSSHQWILGPFSDYRGRRCCSFCAILWNFSAIIKYSVLSWSSTAGLCGCRICQLVRLESPFIGNWYIHVPVGCFIFTRTHAIGCIGRPIFLFLSILLACYDSEMHRPRFYLAIVYGFVWITGMNVILYLPISRHPASSMMIFIDRL